MKGKKGRGGKGSGAKGQKVKEKLDEIAELAELAEKEEAPPEDPDNEKQMKMIEELEAGGEIEDIDLTAEEWVNVNPAEIAKRYEMIRRYVSFFVVFFCSFHRFNPVFVSLIFSMI